MRVFVIAEAGVNHNGELRIAKRLIDVATEAHADAVKFQSFRATNVVGRSSPKAQYQMRSTGAHETQVEMLQRLELTAADHEGLMRHAETRGIAFLSTPFDSQSLRMLTDRLGMRTIKVGSGEITHAPFLLEVARAAPRIILSTGMSTIEEVREALGALAFGFVSARDATPIAGDFARAFGSDEGQLSLRERVTLLHCTSEYPAPFADVNLRAMDALREAFALPVGYSDHTSGIHVSLAAVALGARTIEKHFTLDRQLPGPDHGASLEPEELAELVQQIRDIEQAMGDGVKQPSKTELGNRDVVRRSVVAARPIEAGEVFTEQNITCKRPATGVAPIGYWRFLGQASTRNYKTDETLDSWDQ